MNRSDIIKKLILDGKLDEELDIKNGDSLQRYNVVQELFPSRPVDSSKILEKYHYIPTEPLRIQPGQIPPNTTCNGKVPPKTDIGRIFFERR